MLKSKKTFLGIVLCAVMTLCLTIGIFTGISTSKTAYAVIEHDHSTWIVWGDDDNEKTSLPTDVGDYVLTSDITLSATWTVPIGETNLCLNGHIVKADCNGENNFGVISVDADATLNLYDCDAVTKYYFTKDVTTGLWTLAQDQTTPTDYFVTGGIITGGNVTGSGGGVYVFSGAFNMYGGNIVGNTARDGGGVNNVGTFCMYGGSIIGNSSTASGGGVYSSSTSVSILTGGTITDNTSSVGGGLCFKTEMCFAAGTPITMADGSRQLIETLDIGSEVRVFDHETGEVSSAKVSCDFGKYPEKHSDVVILHFTNNIDLTIVYGHSFFEKEQNKYVSITKDNVASYVGREFYNVDDARFEKLIGYDLVDEKVDTYIITTEYHLNCVANGMLAIEDGFYTTLANIFEYGKDLKFDADKKASDIKKYGIYEFENLRYASKETYDFLNLQYLNVAFGKGLLTPEDFAYIEAYWTRVCPEIYCYTEEEEPEENLILFGSFLMASLSETPVLAPTTDGVYVGGSIKIFENNGGNLNISSGKTITIGTGTVGDGNGVVAPSSDMSIGVTLDDLIGQFTNNGRADDVKYFFSDDSDYKVCFNNSGTTGDETDDYLELKKLVSFSSEYQWNNGTSITYGDTYSEIAPTIKDGEEELTEITLIKNYYQTTNGGTTWTKLNEKPTNAGNYKIVFEVPYDTVYYCGSKEYTFSIAQKEIAKPQEDTTVFTYNGQPQTYYVAESDVYTINGNVETYVDNYTVTVSLKDKVNYKWVGGDSEDLTFSFKIKQATDEISVDTTTIIKTYGEQITLPEATSIFGTVTCDTLVADLVDAGTYTVTYTLAETDNYTGDEKKLTVVIEKTVLTVTAYDNEIYYGDQATDNGVEYDGFVNDDTYLDLDGTLSYKYLFNSGNTVEYYVGANVGEYKILPSGLTSNNYDITFESGTLYVMKAYNYLAGFHVEDCIYGEELTVSDCNYGFGNIVYSYKKFVNGYVEVSQPIESGTYLAKATIYETDNYYGATATTTFTIYPRAISIKLNDVDKQYGENTEYGYTVINGTLKRGDELKLNYVVKNASENVGVYEITAKINGSDNPNYEIFTVYSGALNIKAVDLSTISDGLSLEKGEYLYDGSAKMPKVTLTYLGKSLEENKDYTLVYVDNVYEGTASVKVYGQGNFTGETEKSFNINKFSLSSHETFADFRAVAIAERENGFVYDVELVAEVKSDVKNYAEFCDKGKKAIRAYGVKLMYSGQEIQPNGDITLKLIIPSEVLNGKEFELLSVSDGIAKKCDYEIKDGYAVLRTDKLSEYVFVTETAHEISNLWICVGGAGITCIIVLILLLVVKAKNKKE